MEATEKENSDENMYEPFEKDPKLENFDLNIKDEEEKIDKFGEIPEGKPQKKKKMLQKISFGISYCFKL